VAFRVADSERREAIVVFIVRLGLVTSPGKYRTCLMKGKVEVSGGAYV
jgi:hypothetical protein